MKYLVGIRFYDQYSLKIGELLSIKRGAKWKDLEKRVKQVIGEHTGIPIGNIQLNSDLREDLGIDSFAAIELVFSLKEKFGLNLEDAELQQIKKVCDVVNLIKNKV